jgi:predicted negative regulator of RcsB-dependent stress response
MKMKTGIALLLIFAMWFGWQRYTEHQRGLAREAQERYEGYERCVAPLNQSFTESNMYGQHPSKELMQDFAKARQDCANFWFMSPDAYRKMMTAPLGAEPR